MGAKTAEINSYVKKRKREIDLEADLRAARGKKDDSAVLRIESQLQSIKDSYTRMSIWPLIEAGEFSAISSGQVTAEDLALSDGRWSNFLAIARCSATKSLGHCLPATRWWRDGAMAPPN